MIITFYDPINLRFGGGAEYWLLDVSKRLSQRGHTINVASLEYVPIVNLYDIESQNYFRYCELPYIKLPMGN